MLFHLKVSLIGYMHLLIYMNIKLNKCHKKHMIFLFNLFCYELQHISQLKRTKISIGFISS